MNEGGGQTAPLGLGFGTARETYEKLHAYIRGFEDGVQHANTSTGSES
jgi:hypothetical protein